MRQATRTRWATVLLGALTGLAPATAATPAQVQSAIERGQAFLLSHQRNGNWEVIPARDPTDDEGPGVRNVQWGGLTAVATLALLASGVDANEPHLKRAVAFLRAADLRGNYALGMRAQVWALLPPEPWVRQAAAADLQRLERAIFTGKEAGPAAGLYGYAAGRPLSEADHSVSQIDVLGVWALAQAGVEVPSAYWQLIDAAWHRQQQPNGSWGYRATIDPKDPPPADQAPGPSMTAAGVATLFITREFTQIAPRCGGNVDDPAIDAGLAFLGQHLPENYPGRRYYALFAYSRVGLASGYRRLGKTDWFQWGSDMICQEQSATGEWNHDGNIQNFNDVPDTAFALLFLARGRAPVLMNKLRYDVTAGAGKAAQATPGLWNQRPRDAANLTRWVGKQIESTLNWQVVTLDDAAEDLHDAPILYMAGGRAPKLSAADTAKLRAYLEDGGLVVGHADCAAADFTKGFKALGAAMFPPDKFPAARFRPLEPTSPIYTNQTFAAAAWKAGRPTVEALSNGSRELMVLLPSGDPARTWQSQSFQSAKRETFGQLMVDLFLYAVDKEGLRRRGETYLVARKGSVPAATKVVKVARLSYAGNWDPEPGGWRRLANVMHNDGAAEVTTDAVDGPIDKSHALASLTIGDAGAKLTEAQRSAIRDYVNGGGTLLVDVAGGRSLYRAAAEAELAQIFPQAPRDWPVLPADSPVYRGGKGPLGPVDFRRFQRPGNGHVPLVRGYTVDGRVAALYSPEDLSTGLVGEPVDGVAGYVPASATAVAGHLLLYAAR